MTVELGLIFAAVACIIGIAGYIGGQKTRAKNSGEEWGTFSAELRTDVKHIKDDIAEVKAQNKVFGDQYANMRIDVEVVKRDLKTAFSKIDDIKARGT